MTQEIRSLFETYPATVTILGNYTGKTLTDFEAGLGTFNTPGAFQAPDALTLNGTTSATLTLRVGETGVNPVAADYFLWGRYKDSPNETLTRRFQILRVITTGGTPISPAVDYVQEPVGETPGNVATVGADGHTVEWDTPAAGGVTSFQTRTGAVSVTKADVTGTGLAAADVGAATTAALAAEVTRATTAETANATAITNEATTARTAEGLKLAKASNLSDLANAGTARTNLGIGNVDNTSDVNKPVSTAQAAADAVVQASVTAETSRATAAEIRLVPAWIAVKTTTYTAAVGEFVPADTTTAGFTVNLPANPAVGALVGVKKVSTPDSNTLTIAPAGGGTIDGDPNATTTTLGGGAIFEHVGSNVWRIVAVTLTTGPAGAAGRSVLNGSGAPGSGVGNDGDFYIDTTAHVLYGPKASGAWPGSGITMVGTNGTNGTNGAISVVKDEGSSLTVRSTVNFIGAGVTATDNAGTGATDVTIPGGGSSVPLAGSVVGWYYTTQSAATATVGASNTTLNLCYYVPIWLEAGTLDRFAQQYLSGTATAAETVRMGLYSDNGRGFPGTLVTSGSVDLSVAAIRTVTVSPVITRGLYWTALVRQGTGVTVGLLEYSPTNANSAPGPLAAAMPSFSSNLFDAVRSLTQSGVSGALPSTAAPTAGAQKIVPVYVRYGA